MSFHKIQDNDIWVVDKFLLELEAQLEVRGVELEVDPAARAWLAVHGHDPKMGARPMARVIQEQIKRPLAEKLLFGKLVHGGLVKVGAGPDGLTLAIEAKPEGGPQGSPRQPIETEKQQ